MDDPINELKKNINNDIKFHKTSFFKKKREGRIFRMIIRVLSTLLLITQGLSEYGVNYMGIVIIILSAANAFATSWYDSMSPDSDMVEHADLLQKKQALVLKFNTITENDDKNLFLNTVAEEYSLIGFAPII